MIEISLNGKWMLREQPLHVGETQYSRVLSERSGWIETTVPGDISSALIEAGKIKEPTVGLNCFESGWVEDRSWWLKKEFTTEGKLAGCDRIELVLDGLDSIAAVFLNHQKLSGHSSAFRPLIADVKDLLAPSGESNLLLIRLTSGLEHFSKEDIAELEPYVNVEPSGNRGDKRRVFVRKPQDFFGVDWNPRIPTCGITGGALIRGFMAGTVRDVFIRTSLANDEAALQIEVTVESFDWIGTSEGMVRVVLVDPDGARQEVDGQFLMKSGLNYCRLGMLVKKPMLWWPNGSGAQNLYSVSVSARVKDLELSYPAFNLGIRTVEIDMSKVEGGRLFAFLINGRRIFCKGANWAPADSLYARVTDEKYERLLELASAAHINMLRICGGGTYEKNIFYELCDRKGILIWQDFMFCTAAYPDNKEWFVSEIREEARYQLARLRMHPCISLWSGNNENHTGFHTWWKKETRRGSYLYNHLLPDLAHHYCPDIPYWNGAPYGGEDPNSSEIGDTHYYLDTDEKRIENLRKYDEIDFRFVSEFGHIGACSKESTHRYLGGAFLRGSKEWIHHTNLNEKGTLVSIVERMYTEKKEITEDQFLVFGGLVQGVLHEYTIDSLRAKPHCSGALFWMFTDCWGEIGWSIVDYYAEPKIAYYFVRRAFSTKRLIIRKRDGIFCAILVNDTVKEMRGEVEFGYGRFDGHAEGKRTSFTVGPFQRAVVAQLKDPGFDLREGYVFAQPVPDRDLNSAIYRDLRTSNLSLRPPRIVLQSFQVDKGGASVELETDVYAHAVHFELPAGSAVSFSDNYFDLLPKEKKRVRIEGRGLSRDMLHAGSTGAGIIWS